MSWTKRQFVVQAFEEIGLAAYVYDLTPDQLQSAVRRMDTMIAGWNANGIRIGYPLSTSPQTTDLDADTGVPDAANEAIILGLACRLAPSYGKAVSPETKMYADLAYSQLANKSVVPTMERQMPRTMPRGAGTKPWRNFNNPFVNAPETDRVDAGADGPLNLDE